MDIVFEPEYSELLNHSSEISNSRDDHHHAESADQVAEIDKSRDGIDAEGFLVFVQGVAQDVLLTNDVILEGVVHYLGDFADFEVDEEDQGHYDTTQND